MVGKPAWCLHVCMSPTVSPHLPLKHGTCITPQERHRRHAAEAGPLPTVFKSFHTSDSTLNSCTVRPARHPLAVPRSLPLTPRLRTAVPRAGPAGPGQLAAEVGAARG